MYIAENSPIGSTVGELYAKDPDEGLNAVVQYSIIGNLKSFEYIYHHIIFCLHNMIIVINVL